MLAVVASTQAQRDTLFEQFTAPIRAELDKMGFEYEIKARVKSPYSIWNKMQNKHQQGGCTAILLHLG